MARYVRIALPLVLICTLCAALLGASYLITAEPIAANEKAVVDGILHEVYGDNCLFEEVAAPENEKATAAFRVSDQYGAVAGYAVRTVCAGFAGEIDIMVGFDEGLAIRKIEIVSMSETAGLGSRIGEESYLREYAGKSKQKLTVGEDIDAITGATKSSKALCAGVNNALACVTALAES